MTNRLNPVAWTEGLFLRPQHLQHQDLVAAEELNYRLGVIDPFHWGIRDLEIDPEALTDHRIAITRLDAVLPGGTVIMHPGNAAVETREFDPTVQNVDVYVGVRHWSTSDPNSAPDAARKPDTRFVLRSHKARDLHSGGDEAELTLSHPNVRVFFGDEANLLELHESIRIGRVMATGELARPFALDPTQAPPLLRVEAWPTLHDEVAKIVNQMAGRIRVVVGRTQTLSTGDLPRYWMRYTLSRLTPVLRHLLSCGFTRPFDLYTALLEAASALSAFQTSEAIELPPYDHNDLVGCFNKVLAHIDMHLGEAVPTRFTELKLEWRPADRCYVTEGLNTTLVDPRNLIYLAIKAPMDSGELAKWVVDQGKASSGRGVKALAEFALPGLRIEHLPAAPTEIASHGGFEYFRIETHSAQWNKVREDASFGLSLGRLEDADARLYVVTPEE